MTEEQMRAEFDAWFKRIATSQEEVPSVNESFDAGWQACQAVNDERIEPTTNYVKITSIKGDVDFINLNKPKVINQMQVKIKETTND